MQDVIIGATVPETAQVPIFCALTPHKFGWTHELFAALRRKCLPVFITESLLQPLYNHAINWKRVSVKWSGQIDEDLIAHLRAIPAPVVQAAQYYAATVRALD